MEKLLEPRTVTFDTNGGSSIGSQTLFKNEIVARPADPLKKGCNFDGWFRDNSSFLSQWDFKIAPSGDITLFAKWEIISKVEGAAVDAPELHTFTADSITIFAVAAPGNGQTVEYAISTNNSGTGWFGWQTGLTFSGLSGGVSYYVYARSAENDYYHAGNASVSGAMIINSNSSDLVFSPEDEAPELENIIIYRSNNSETRPASVTLTITGAYTGPEWYYNGILLSNTASVTLSASDPRYNMIGEKFLTLEVLLNGVPFSRTITFRVEP